MNKLRMLPAGIGGLRSLTVLKLEKNQIRALPKELGSLTALVELQVGDNFLNSLPVELGALGGLKKIGLSGNPMMHTLPGSSKPLWEIWYGEVAGPMPDNETNCKMHPAESTGTIKMRTRRVLQILRADKERTRDQKHIEQREHTALMEPSLDCGPPSSTNLITAQGQRRSFEERLSTEGEDLGEDPSAWRLSANGKHPTQDSDLASGTQSSEAADSTGKKTKREVVDGSILLNEREHPTNRDRSNISVVKNMRPLWRTLLLIFVASIAFAVHLFQR
ncbi:hypothetical protein BSKO_12360 [Bryopsis sp. KO-2023]|nr:hypothetical protein BSKO_12360 [Bryopsis sp. KO-2023]